MDDATRKELEQIRKRVEAATPGPWEMREGLGFNILNDGTVLWKPGIQREDDIEFIANSRQDIPRLLSIIEEQERELTLHKNDVRVDVGLFEELKRRPAEARRNAFDEAIRIVGTFSRECRKVDVIQVLTARRDAESKQTETLEA